MNTIGIQLPDALKAFVDEQVAKGEHRDASEFVQSLLEAEVRRRIGRELEQALLGAADGPLRIGPKRTWKTSAERGGALLRSARGGEAPHRQTPQV